MKFTCLSKGRGFHFPPCHMVNVCGVQILVDCPLDLSSLAIFSPIPTVLSKKTYSCSDHKCYDSESLDPKRQKREKSLEADDLIKAEPWYKTVNNLHLWDISFIDVVLISSPMGMLGLPFLTRSANFSAQIYMTEAAARICQLMMKDLISMHEEFRNFYGPEDSSCPQWMNWKELELLPSLLKEIALGKDGTELGGWMPLYSATDVKDCFQKVQTLKYAEETSYNGMLIVKAFSSGLGIGTCNWMISSPKGNIVCLSSSIVASAIAMDFNYLSLQENDLILYSDFSFMNDTGNIEDGKNSAASGTSKDDGDNFKALNTRLLNTDENLEELEKINYICSCATASAKAGGSVIIPIHRIEIILQLLELIPSYLESSNLKVPIFIVSSVAEELLALTNIIPEWLCNQRQEKLFSNDSQPLFAHVNFLKDGKIQLFPTIHSQKLLTSWQEPCIVFSPHWCLRLGPTVHFLERFCGDPNSLLVMEDAVDFDLALLPFKPMAMKILNCSFVCGMKMHKIQPLFDILQPKSVLMPNELKHWLKTSNKNPFMSIQYSENETVRIPRLKDGLELEIHYEEKEKIEKGKGKGKEKYPPRLKDSLELNRFANLTKKENKTITRLKGELFMYGGRYQLVTEACQAGSSQSWAMLQSEKLLGSLQKMGMVATIDRGENSSSGGGDSGVCVFVNEPKKALVVVGATSTLIRAADESFASLIFEAIDGGVSGI